MTDDEGLSVREAIEWCGTGVTVREVTRLRPLTQDPLEQRRMSARRSVRPASALRDGGRPSGGQHPDQEEGPRAFAERREPVWQDARSET